MTIHEALRILSTSPAYQRVQVEQERFHTIADVVQFQAALLDAFTDTPLIQQALRVFWDHYAALLGPDVVWFPLDACLN